MAVLLLPRGEAPRGAPQDGSGHLGLLRQHRGSVVPVRGLGRYPRDERGAKAAPAHPPRGLPRTGREALHHRLRGLSARWRVGLLPVHREPLQEHAAGQALEQDDVRRDLSSLLQPELRRGRIGLRLRAPRRPGVRAHRSGSRGARLLVLAPHDRRLTAHLPRGGITGSGGAVKTTYPRRPALPPPRGASRRSGGRPRKRAGSGGADSYPVRAAHREGRRRGRTAPRPSRG